MKVFILVLVAAIVFSFPTSADATPMLISQGKPVSGSGYFGDGTNPSEREIFPFDNVNDGKFDDTGSPGDWSFWLTGHNETGYFVIDLLSLYEISVFQIQNTHNRHFNDRGTKDFHISLSHDGITYETVVQDTLASVFGTGNNIPLVSYTIPITSARYVRFDVDSYYLDSGGINELSVFGEPVDGLIAYYSFNRSATDDSGNGNHGTVYGATLTTDRFGNPDSAYHFDGIDDYIEVNPSNNLDIADEITIAAWVRIEQPGGYGSPQHYVVDSRDGNGGGYGLNVDTDRIQMGVGDHWADLPLQFQASSWHHIAGTYDGSEVIVYIDGFETASVSYGGWEIKSSSKPLYIGQWYAFGERFDGVIDEVYIYDRALSENEIKKLYNPGAQPRAMPWIPLLLLDD